MMTSTTHKSALLVMDMQTAIVSMLPDSSALVANMNTAIAFARTQDIPVLYVRVGFRNSMPEVSPDNKGFAAMKDRLAGMSMEEWLTIAPSVAPLPDDIIITKRRVSAFSGSDLEVVLRAMNIRHLVLTGIATSGVVLSTIREAADKDFQLTVIADCCADQDDEVHRILTTKVFPRQATVVSVAEWSNPFA